VHKVGKIFESMGIVFLLVLIFSVTTQIVMRNLFNAGSVALEELARFSLVSIVFLMIPVLTIEKKQIIVDIVLLYLPRRARKAFDLAVDAIGCGFSIFILVAISMIMRRNWNVRTPALRMPNVLLYLPVAAGITLNFFGSLWHFIRTVSGKEAAK
jgi:TRAP-type transport system small permease protein